VTVISVALASGLMVSVFSIDRQCYEAFVGAPIGFDAVLGARGSKLQLVLNTMFHLETSPGNIPWSLYQHVKQDRRVKLAIPYALGDNYLGYRIVGTDPALLTDFEFKDGSRYRLRPRQPGEPFEPRTFSNTAREAVVGSFAAQQTGLRIGSVFQPYHGLDFNPRDQHTEEFVVVGVLEPTNSPSDRVIWIPIEGVFRMAGHSLKGTGEIYIPQAGAEIPDEHKEVSAVLIKLRDPRFGPTFEHEVNKQGNVATLAWPIGTVMIDLFGKIGWMSSVLHVVAYLIVFVAATSILASIYNTLNERRREFAILRAIGARRGSIFAIVVTQAAAISLLGAVLGMVVYGAILAGARGVIQFHTGVVLDLFYYHDILWQGPLIVVAAGCVAGMIPALRAYQTDVAANLTATN
jgi:putative ABC transport system permease protein